MGGKSKLTVSDSLNDGLLFFKMFLTLDVFHKVKIMLIKKNFQAFHEFLFDDDQSSIKSAKINILK